MQHGVWGGCLSIVHPADGAGAAGDLENSKDVSGCNGEASVLACDGRLAPERRRWAVAAIFAAMAMASLDTAIANVALPAIAGDLHVSPADAVWVVNVYQIALVATLLPLGALGESSVMSVSISAVSCCSHWHRWMRLRVVTGKPVGCPGAAGTGRQRIMAVNSALIRFIFPSASWVAALVKTRWSLRRP